MLKDLVIEVDHFFAHIKKDKKNETLLEHSDLVFNYYKKSKDQSNMDLIIKKLCADVLISGDMTDDVLEEMLMMFDMAIYLHDIGKINPSFQKNKMSNTKYNDTCRTLTSEHSLISSVIYIDVFSNRINNMNVDDEFKGFLMNILYHFSYVISKHHGKLQNLSSLLFDKSLDRMVNIIENNKFMLDYYVHKDRLINSRSCKEIQDTNNVRYTDLHNPLRLWLLNKLLYSFIVRSDFMATFEYMNDLPFNLYITSDDKKSELRNQYENYDIVKGIRSYEKGEKDFKDTPINKLRSDMFIEAENNLIKNKDKNIFYLEAPTGGGKTISSINLALSLLDNNDSINRIEYIFPFNTLIEQTNGIMDDIFGERSFKTINSITPITDNEETWSSSEYTEVFLRHQLFEYSLVMTSHVNLFNRIFSFNREDHLSFLNLCNSVIVIDEVQSYNNTIWLEIITVLHEISDYFNIKFIIMSATLPNLSKMIKKENHTVNLIQNREMYFKNSLFKDRVKLDFHLLEKDLSIEELLIEFVDIVNKEGNKKYLVEFISKKSARKFYDELKIIFSDRKVIEITGDDNSYYRKKMIEDIKKEEHLIVIATQVIEAGVDIDMDIGFKDISILDGEEQFLGRINRSCKKEGKAYFFNLDRAANIYRNDWRTERNLKRKDIQEYLLNKDFSEFYNVVFKRILTGYEKKKFTVDESLDDMFDKMDYLNIYNYMKLINNRGFDVFFNFDLVMEDGNILIGRDVWNEYKNLVINKEIDFSEKKIKKSMLQKELSYFIYTVYAKGDLFPYHYNDTLGDIFYIDNGEDFMVDDRGIKKFNRDKYTKGVDFL